MLVLFALSVSVVKQNALDFEYKMVLLPMIMQTLPGCGLMGLLLACGLGTH
jgi:hypothetical protein